MSAIAALASGRAAAATAATAHACEMAPESVARAIFDGVENGEEDIFPAAVRIADRWRSGAVKEVEQTQQPCNSPTPGWQESSGSRPFRQPGRAS